MKIRTLLPYFILISLYFLFINLEISKEKKINSNRMVENLFDEDKSVNEPKQQLRISIPVVPYSKKDL